MRIWAIADLHLSISVPEKSMEAFGDRWKNYQEKIEKNWKEKVDSQDLVLLPGDICWAMTLEEAKKDLLWIEKLPGSKIMIKGNHDYWWSSKSKVEALLPPTLSIIQNNSIMVEGVAIGGSRLWDSPEFDFHTLFKDLPKKNGEEKEEKIQEDLKKKIYERELGRLEMSLRQMPEDAKLKIAMTHYPPLGADMKDSAASLLFEEYGIDIVLFGHLHGLSSQEKLFGEKNGVHYHLTASDYLSFEPLLVASV